MLTTTTSPRAVNFLGPFPHSYRWPTRPRETAFWLFKADASDRALSGFGGHDRRPCGRGHQPRRRHFYAGVFSATPAINSPSSATVGTPKSFRSLRPEELSTVLGPRSLELPTLQSLPATNLVTHRPRGRPPLPPAPMRPSCSPRILHRCCHTSAIKSPFRAACRMFHWWVARNSANIELVGSGPIGYLDLGADRRVSQVGCRLRRGSRQNPDRPHDPCNRAVSANTVANATDW